MARGKKKEPLTPEERLQAALVPEGEQPYKVPGNWCWVRLGEFSTSQYGYTAKAIKNDAHPKMLRITDIQEYGVNWSDVPNCEITPQNLEKYRLCSGDIVIARTGATTGKSFFLNNPCNSVFASYLIRLRVSDRLSSQYVFNFLQTDNYWKQISELSSGIAQPGVNATKLQSLCFPLAPHSEQQRIVDRIESLFAKLDEAKEKVQDTLDSFETRKAAILHKAFTGELTAQWRKEHGVGMESWENKTLQQLSQKIGDGLHGTPVYSENGAYFFINGNNFSGLKIEIKPDTKRVDYSQYQKYKIELGDNTVLVSINGTLGKTALYKNELVVLGKSACYINVGEKLNKFFLRYFLESTEFLNYADKMATGSTIKNLGLKAMRNLMLKLPSVPEQTEIVRLLDDLIAKEQRAKEAAERVLGQIDLIKKAILARAFRGELGTNAPNEESAVELLKQVL